MLKSPPGGGLSICLHGQERQSNVRGHPADKLLELPTRLDGLSNEIPTPQVSIHPHSAFQKLRQFPKIEQEVHTVMLLYFDCGCKD